MSPVGDVWQQWSKTIVDDLSHHDKRIATVEKVLFEKGESGQPHIVGLVKAIAWQLLLDLIVMRDTGAFDSARLYGAGAAVTHKGSLWVAQVETRGARPGEAAGIWRLMSKSGKPNGKDAKP